MTHKRTFAVALKIKKRSIKTLNAKRKYRALAHILEAEKQRYQEQKKEVRLLQKKVQALLSKLGTINYNHEKPDLPKLQEDVPKLQEDVPKLQEDAINQSDHVEGRTVCCICGGSKPRTCSCI